MREKFVPTAALPTPPPSGGGRESEAPCSHGIRSWYWTALCQNVHENRFLGLVKMQTAATSLFSGKGWWPPYSKVTLRILAAWQQRELGVAARGRDKEKTARLEHGSRDKDRVEMLGFAEMAEGSGVEWWVSLGEPGQTPRQNKESGVTLASLPQRLPGTQGGAPQAESHTCPSVSPEAKVSRWPDVNERARTGGKRKRAKQVGDVEEAKKEEKKVFQLYQNTKSFPTS